MYPRQELTVLAGSKAALLGRIRSRRAFCSAAAEQAARPVRILDRWLARWRRLSPTVKLAAVPLGLLLARSLRRRAGAFGALARWGPVLVSAARMAGARSFARRT